MADPDALKKLKQEQAGRRGKKTGRGGHHEDKGEEIEMDQQGFSTKSKKNNKSSKHVEVKTPKSPHHGENKSKSKSKKHKKPVGYAAQASIFMGSLPTGFVVKSKRGSFYNVEAKITERLYVVRNKASDRLYAMKIEMQTGSADYRQLKRDVFTLMDSGKHPKRFNRHFPKLHTKGRIPGAFNYLLMTLCDHNLDDLRTTVLEGCDFSKANAARMCMQSFQAIHDLHSMGYMHRNISPTKFLLGLDNPHMIYLVGFSMGYHFEQRYDVKVSTSPRKLSKLSKRSFLPRSYHRGKEFNRKDDLEAWVYLCFNLFGRRILPWNEEFNDLNMLVNKERFFCGEFEECYKFVPLQFKTIMSALDKMSEKDRPDYTFVGMMLVTMKESIKFELNGPFDWQKGADKEFKKEKEEDGGEELELDDGKKHSDKEKKSPAAGKKKKHVSDKEKEKKPSEKEKEEKPPVESKKEKEPEEKKTPEEDKKPNAPEMVEMKAKSVKEANPTEKEAGKESPAYGSKYFLDGALKKGTKAKKKPKHDEEDESSGGKSPAKHKRGKKGGSDSSSSSNSDLMF